MKKKEKVPSFPGFCIKYCAGLCSTLTVCRFPVSFVAHSCLLCHALHIAQSPSSLHCWMPDVHTAINMGGPILGSCPPILCRCLTRQLLISSMAPNMFFLSVFCPREMTAGDFHLKEGEIRNCPPTRDLYTSHQTFVGTQNALVIITVTAPFRDNSMGTQRTIWGTPVKGQTC